MGNGAVPFPIVLALKGTMMDRGKLANAGAAPAAPRGRRLRRRGVAAAIAGVAFVCVVAWNCAPSALAMAASAPPNTVTPIGYAPNFFYDHIPADNTNSGFVGNSVDTEAFADPANRLLFEYNSDDVACTNLAVYDIDRYALLATDAVGPPDNCRVGIGAEGQGGSKSLVAAVDSTDHLLLVHAFDGQTLADGISAVAERSLTISFNADTPSLGPSLLTPNVVGLSWYAPTDDLIDLLQPLSGGLTVSSYHIPDLIASHGAAPPRWTATVPGCQAPLEPLFGTAAAYLTAGGHSLLVPCTLIGDQQTELREGVVKLTLGSGGPTAAAPVVAVAPGAISDVYFDPGSDRMFMPTQNPTGVDLLVYDGDAADFAGKVNVGTGADENSVAFGADPQRGRLYSVAPHSGMTLIDTRDTPVSDGAVFRQYARSVNYVNLAAIPPDATDGFARLLVDNNTTCGSNACAPNFIVYADTIGVQASLPPSSVDTNTLTGPVPPGATLTTAYSGSASGYGYHDDFVGGANAVVTNASEGLASTSGPFTGSSDLLGADVRRLSVDSTNGKEGDASAFGDGSGATSGTYQECTGTSAVTCVPPPPCPQSGSGAPCVPAPGQPPVSAGSQPWPFPEAQCVSPGGASTDTVNGVYYEAGAGSSSPAPATGSDSQNTAEATVNCQSNNAATAAAQLGQARTGAASLPGVSMGYASSSAVITPGAAGSGILTAVTSEATGVSIDLGNGVNITFGDVKHVAHASAAGTPGSASAQDLVSISHVYVNGQDECAASADNCAAAIDQINAEFPTLIKIIEQPARDSRYANSCVADGSQSGQVDCQGSPGGYLAAIQSTLDEQYGDQQFNGMSEEESTLLPAMRIILYGSNDGVPSLSRQIIDLAGVLATASQGIQAIPAGGGDAGGGGNVTSFPQSGCAACAGIPSTPVATTTTPPGPGGILGTIERILSGLNWLIRNPGEVLQMAAFLALLGLPMMLMRRRWHAGTGRGATT